MNFVFLFVGNNVLITENNQLLMFALSCKSKIYPNIKS